MPHSKLKLGVLVSGNGSNLQAILEACKKGEIDATVEVVVSNNPDAFALKRAAEFGVPTAVVPDTPEAESEIAAILKTRSVDLVCLAGFMRILSGPLLKAFPRRILNIHPALLPAFPGLHAQKQAFDYGVKISGATVHFVDKGCDTGPILLQKAVSVEEDDTAETLRKKILKLEHEIYPQAIQRIATQPLKIAGRRVLTAAGEG